MQAWLIWLITATVLLIAELFSLEFVLIMFALGAFAASLAAYFGVGLVAQSLIFAGVSVLALVVARPSVRRALMRGSDPTPVGIDALVGKTAVVLRRTDELSGLVKLEGEEWSARTHDPREVYTPPQYVEVVEIKGATAVVRKRVES